ncbi:hypothetical protein PMM47T1_15201 [Pseudomonas sp. M47T1]|uniref:hypothetical protein n=1 Tax=unclassified Pseudomonas TaxID=196821 RepID=UPI0002607297|nr:hypothetical protein [Pseudomonas sp. M47T1]EIK95744.1 hypothetical protein PMM47T1_15201 [Pseudomonas sp. M47T1]
MRLKRKLKARPPRRLVEEVPVNVQDALQDQLRAYLGRGFTPVLLGSGGSDGSRRYHLQIHHDRSGQYLELHGDFDAHGAEAIFKVAHQMKTMLQPAANALGNNVRLIARITDLPCPDTLKDAARRLATDTRRFQLAKG